jgi:hypothetical protein
MQVRAYKPETLARLAAERKQQRAKMRAESVARLTELAARDRDAGIPNAENIWLDLLADVYGVR